MVDATHRSLMDLLTDPRWMHTANQMTNHWMWELSPHIHSSNGTTWWLIHAAVATMAYVIMGFNMFILWLIAVAHFQSTDFLIYGGITLLVLFWIVKFGRFILRAMIVGFFIAVAWMFASFIMRHFKWIALTAMIVIAALVGTAYFAIPV